MTVPEEEREPVAPPAQADQAAYEPPTIESLGTARDAQADVGGISGIAP